MKDERLCIRKKIKFCMRTYNSVTVSQIHKKYNFIF